MAQRRGNVTREKIMEIATELINERGYRGMSLEDVAKRLKVTRPALYYYYSRKDQLLLDIHNRAQSRLVESAQEIYAQEQEPLERVIRLLHNHALVVTRHAKVVAVMFEAENDLAQHERRKIRNVRIEYSEGFIDAVEQARKAGYFSAESNSRLSAFLMLGACNWITRWYEPGEWTPEHIAATVTETVLHGVLSDEGRAAIIEKGLTF